MGVGWQGRGGGGRENSGKVVDLIQKRIISNS